MSDWYWHVPGDSVPPGADRLSDDEVLDVLDQVGEYYRDAMESLAETVIPAETKEYPPPHCRAARSARLASRKDTPA